MDKKHIFLVDLFLKRGYIAMVKKAKVRNPKRIRELRIRINTQAYLQLAIARIASLLTKEFITN